MNLNDVLYIIDGSLEVQPLDQPTEEGHVFRATLYDNIHDPCMLQGTGLVPEPDSQWRYPTATATGITERGALERLVERIAGNSLGHDFPVMWKSYTEWVRIPPSLAVGTSPLVNVERPYKTKEPTEEPKPAA